MGDEMMLARLMAQAEALGGDLSTITAIAEEASEAGARRALAGLGLSDADAPKDMAELRELLIVADDAELTIDIAGGFGGGRVRWLTGANSGLESMVLVSAGALLTLREPPAFVAAAGNRIEVSEGCDKTLATCRSRFGNAANFRGEPFLPGIDLLTRYPGAGLARGEHIGADRSGWRLDARRTNPPGIGDGGARARAFARGGGADRPAIGDRGGAGA
jgi:hypothetical protein